MLTPKQYAKEHGISYYLALKHYKKNDLPLEGSGGKNRKVMSNVFKVDDNDSDYWLGIMAADGYISGSSISLGLKDEEHVVKFKDFVEPNLNVKKRKNRGYYTVTYRHLETLKFLHSVGIVDNKTKILNYIGKLSSHFVRGYFDGDGYVGSKYLRPKITTASSTMVNKFTLLFDSLGYKYSVLTKDSKGECLDINLLGDSRYEFLDWIYRDSKESTRLERKYRQYCAFTS